MSCVEELPRGDTDMKRAEQQAVEADANSWAALWQETDPYAIDLAFALTAWHSLVWPGVAWWGCAAGSLHTYIVCVPFHTEVWSADSNS